jgi:plasmid stabilization system protein ParE
VATVSYSRAAVADLERLARFLLEAHPEHVEATTGLIVEALAILQRHPLIGRPSEAGLHELLISRGRSGYVALYEYLASTDQGVVHRIRHQREAGFEQEAG